MKQIFKKLTASVLVVMMLASSLLAAGLVQTLAAVPDEVQPQAASATVTYWMYPGFGDIVYDKINPNPLTYNVGDTITLSTTHTHAADVPYGWVARWYCKQDGKFYAIGAPYTVTEESVDFYMAAFYGGVDDIYDLCPGYDGGPMEISMRTVTFEGEGVSENPITKYEGEVITLPTAPEGKVWTAEDGTVYESGAAYVLLDDVTLTAKGKDNEEEKPAVEATITYWMYPGFGDIVYDKINPNPLTCNVGDTITLSTAHTHAADVPYGWVARWYCKQDGKFYAIGAPYTVTEESVDFYMAAFYGGVDDIYDLCPGYDGGPMEISMRTATFEGAGVNENPITKYEGEVITLPTAPDGLSWKSDVDGKYYASGATFVLLDDVNFTAEVEQEAEKYTVTYDGDGVSIAPTTVEEGTTIKLPNAPERYGYNFTGWKCSVDEKVYKAGESYTVNADVTFTAQWEQKTAVLVSFTGATTSGAPAMGFAGDPYTLPNTTETRAGETFVGWTWEYDEETHLPGEQVILPETTRVVFTAQWETVPTKYTVTFKGDGVSVEPMTVDPGTEIEIPVVTRTGFLAMGWLCDVDGKTYTASTAYTKTKYTVTSDVTFTMKWGYSVMFMGGGSVAGGMMQTVETGATIKLPAVATTQAGKVFAGWKCSVDSKVYQPGDEYTVNSAVTFTAQWEVAKVEYTVKFEGEGVSVEPMIVEKGTEIEIPVVTRTGYILMGWVCSVDGKTYNASTAYTKTKYTVNEDVTFTAKWGYSVMFQGGGSVAGGMMQTVELGATIKLPAVATTQAGKVFAGWKCSVDSKVYQTGDEYTVNSAVTFTAQWEVAKVEYTVKFEGDGVSVEPMLVDPGTEIEIPVVTRAGYILMGWVCSVDGKTYNASTAYTKTKYTVNEDVTFTAKWGYSVMFQGGGSVAGGMMQTVELGATIKLPAVATTQAGKVFAGWKCSVDSKVYQPGDEYTVNSAVTFTAQFETATYTVKYTGDGVTSSEETIAYNTKITLANAPTRAGYTFKGWLCDADKTVYDAGAEYTVTSDVTFTAQWEILTFTVTFVDENGETVSTVTKNYGETLAEEDYPSVPEKEGYTGAWNAVTDPITDNITIKLTYTKDPTDKSTLEEMIKTAEALAEEEYTSETWAALIEALEAAKAAYADEDALQSAINKAAEALASAIQGLEKAPVPDEKKWRLGDVNMDGVVDAYDYLELKRAVLGSFDMPEERNALADVNEDGVVDAYDYLELKRAVLGTYELPEVWIAIEVADGN